LILCTGSQAERYAALNRISLNEHRFIKTRKGDLILLSASEIPGNITKIERMTDRLIALGADLIKDGEKKIHSTGHGNQEDMKMMHEFPDCRFFWLDTEILENYRSEINFILPDAGPRRPSFSMMRTMTKQMPFCLNAGSRHSN